MYDDCFAKNLCAVSSVMCSVKKVKNVRSTNLKSSLMRA